MTKLEKLKKDIGYTKENRQCQNCTHYRSRFEANSWTGRLDIEKDIRCAKYNFVTKKTTTCDEHEKKETK